MGGLDEAVRALLAVYDGLPWWAVPFFWVAMVVVVSSLASLVILIVRAQRESSRRGADLEGRGAGSRDGADEADYLWVFVVPALDEEVTIADSVDRLARVEVTHRRILVIDDGSADRTGEILAGMRHPDLTVLTRAAPNARRGKSEALNDAWRHLHAEVLAAGEYAGWPADRVIFTIVDADGRLDPLAGRVARYFADPRTGGVQAQVRIYNRRSFLTWAQDMEFAIFGRVFQLGRAGWGTANMGGNGQFNRLSALDAVAVPGPGGLGPWRSGRLTEDQDIGLRLIEAGWRGSQARDVTISQQGLNSLSRLYRQRTRWAQGGWQVLDNVGEVIRNRSVSRIGRWDQFWYLMTPVLQCWVGATVVASLVFVAVDPERFQWSIVVIGLAYGFSAVPGVLSVVVARRGRGVGGFLMSVLLAHAYLIYSWLIYPVVYRALLRQIAGRTSWAKTAREAIEAPPAAEAESAAARPAEPRLAAPRSAEARLAAPRAAEVRLAEPAAARHGR